MDSIPLGLKQCQSHRRLGSQFSFRVTLIPESVPSLNRETMNPPTRVCQTDLAAKETRPFDEPSKKHAASLELVEGPRGIGSYRHGAPTELFKPVHGRMQVPRTLRLSMNRGAGLGVKAPSRVAVLLRYYGACY